MDKKSRLKKFFQKPVVQDVGKAASSGLVEALKQADGIANLVPVPGLKLALQSLLTLIQAVDQTAQNSDATKGLQNRIESLTTSILIPIKKVDLKDMPEELVTQLDQLAKAFETDVTNCRVKISHGWFRRFICREDDQKDVANMSKAIDEAVIQFLSVGTITLVENMVQVRRGVDELREQNQIRHIISNKAENTNHSYRSAQFAQRSKCLKGTRVNVLEQIRTFLEDTVGVNLFWLSGIAGSGKSTIAQTVAVEATLLANCIVASFFFSQRGHAELCDPSFVFPTLAYQFSLADAGFRKRVSGIIKEQPDIFEMDYISQYKLLIVEPLKAMDRTQCRIFIVLDAFDECEPRGATAILNALLEEVVDVPKELKVLTTSRPEAHLRDVFYARDNIRKLNLQDIDAKSDICRYLLLTFKQPPVTLATPFDAREEEIFKLGESAGDSFIYAASILRFVFDEHYQDPRGRLDILLGNRTDPEERPYGRLDVLYLSILHQAVPSDANGPIKRRLRCVLGQLVTFREPLPMAVMEKFCGLKSGDVKRTLHFLHSLIQVPIADNQAPRIYHLSFSDFIIDPTRCGDEDLVVDVDMAEREVLSCFDHLSSQLHRNMAGIDDPSLPHSEIDGFQTKVEMAVSPELRYACLYWGSHLMKIKGAHDEKVWAHLQDFLTRCLLWWIEAMALLDTLHEAAESVTQVRTWMATLKGKVVDGSSLLADLLNDAFRFLSYHADTISFNALHVYHSALPFTPTETHLRKIYAHELETTVKARRGVEQKWDPTVMVMRFKAPIWGISWSPNGRFIAATGSKSIEIRDTLIGSSVASIVMPKPLFYVSSYTDKVDVGHRLKALVQIPALPVNGVELSVVKALKHAEDITSLAPISGLKNVLGSLLALFHAGYTYTQHWREEIEKLQLVNGTAKRELRAEIQRLETRIRSFTKVVLMWIKGKDQSDIPYQVLNDLEEFTRTVEVIIATCRQKLSQGSLERFTMVAMGVRAHLILEVSETYLCISNSIEQFMKKETIQLLENVRWIEPIYSKIKNPNLLSRAQPPAECLTGTRRVVLDEIIAWLKDAFAPRLFWLSGIAGSGKSAIAQSASVRAALLADHLVASIFFSQFGYAGLCDASSVFQSLALQLCLSDVGYKERISEVINEHPDIFEKDLQFQYERLITEPLGATHRTYCCILVILDGLDECEPHGATAVLKVLLAEDVNHPKELKILTASRPEVHLGRIFDAQSKIRKLSLEDIETESDIQHYLRTSFEQSPTLLAEGTISELAKRAGNSFVCAATIVRFVVNEHYQQSSIDFLLSNRADPEQHPYAPLDALFLDILQRALTLGANNNEKHRSRTVLGLLVCFREPFPMDEIEAFCGLEPGDVKLALGHLRSLVQVPTLDRGAPRIYDRSFIDFLVDPARCPDRSVAMDIGLTENRIFSKCSSLCNLRLQSTVHQGGGFGSGKDERAMFHLSNSFLSTAQEYACLYWASHLTKIKDVDEGTLRHLDDRCLLRWIETMAYFGMLREAVLHMDQVRTWMISLKGQADKASSLLVDLSDKAFRLLPHHATTISYNSLLIYGTALPTSAKFQQPAVEDHPYGLRGSLRDITGHTDSIPMPALKSCYDFTRALAWSPNNQHIAVLQAHGIELRDSLSGSIVDSFDLSPSLEHALDPKKVSSRCLAFYPDNSRLAYVTGEGGVRVWNTLARTEEFVVTGHEGGLVSVNVSPNGELLVSGSKSGRVQVSNAKNGDFIWAVETGTKLKSTSISPNNRLVVSLSYSRNCGVRIWNANDGHPLSMLPHDAISVSFSPDSKQLSIVDQKGLVRVYHWGVSQKTIEPIQDWRTGARPSCLLFSPDSRQLATAADDNVYLSRGGARDVATLNGHTAPVSSLAFSAGGLTLASGSLDGTVRVWDVSSIGSSRVKKDKQEELRSLRWSPRGQVVMASGHEVSIWNTQDGTSSVLVACWDGAPVAISDCGRYIATHSPNYSNRITTRRIAPDVAQSNPYNLCDVECYPHEFFPNSTRFATTSWTDIITWDASVAHPEVTRLVGHSRRVNELCFVPDGSRLLSRAGEEVLAWNVDTLQLVSRTGNVIPRYPDIKATEDNWVVMILPDSGRRRRLFRLPPGYQPYGFWGISGSWLSKCIMIRCKDGNVLLVNFSALPAAMIGFTY